MLTLIYTEVSLLARSKMDSRCSVCFLVPIGACTSKCQKHFFLGKENFAKAHMFPGTFRGPTASVALMAGVSGVHATGRELASFYSSSTLFFEHIS